MKNKRVLAALLAASCLATSFTACSGDASSSTERYARILSEKRAREGVTYEEANDKMFERNYFGMMMVETGEADACLLYTSNNPG